MFQTSYFNKSFSEFKSALESYDKNFREDLFVKAIEVAENSHKDQFRASGDPYIIHPYEVCKSLIELKLDTETVITGLLHDVIEDTSLNKTQIKTIFGSNVAEFVDGVTKLNKIKFNSGQILDLENLANHKGSLLGRDLKNNQPSQKLFESLLYDALKNTNLN